MGAKRKQPPPMASSSSSSSEEEEEEESIEKLLEPFGKDELLDLLTDACIKNPALLSRLAAPAASDTTHRRLFVHCLGPDATSAALSAAFSPFGVLEECHVVVDRAAGRCRGYGFVTFRRRSAARRALDDTSKRVAGRPVACQLASLGPTVPSSGPAPDPTGRKLFVNNVPTHAAHDRLRKFFSKYGEIEEGPLGADHATGQFRGYAIFLYKSPEGLKKALEEPKKVFDGCELQCQRAHEGVKKKPDTAATAAADTGGQTNPSGVAALPAVQPNVLALTYAAQSLLGLNPLVGLMAQGISPAVGLLGQDAGAGVLSSSVLGVSPATAVVFPSLGQSMSSTPAVPYGAALGLGGSTVGLSRSPAVSIRLTTGVNSVSPSISGAYDPQATLQGLGAFNSSRPSSTSAAMSQPGRGSTRPGLIQHYLGR